jgi:hypothetical protein
LTLGALTLKVVSLLQLSLPAIEWIGVVDVGNKDLLAFLDG